MIWLTVLLHLNHSLPLFGIIQLTYIILCFMRWPNFWYFSILCYHRGSNCTSAYENIRMKNGEKCANNTNTRFHIKISIDFFFFVIFHLYVIIIIIIVMEFNIISSTHYTPTLPGFIIFHFQHQINIDSELLNWISNIFQFHFWMICIPVHN